MIFLPRAVRIYVAVTPCNLRKSFEGLSNEVRSVLGRDPLCGHLFIFVNRRATQVKILAWTRGGYTIVHKRLEKGRFTFPSKVGSATTSAEIEVHELSMLLEGLAVSAARSSARWSPPLVARIEPSR
jgi:transposase